VINIRIEETGHNRTSGESQMGIKRFIQNQIFLPRLKKKEVLVVYDPDRLYEDLCLELDTRDLKVVDAGKSSITSRDQALEALKELGQSSSKLKGLLVYVPAKAPETDEEKMLDPFSLYTVYGPNLFLTPSHHPIR